MILSQHLRNSGPWLSDFSRLFDTAFQRQSNSPQGLRIHQDDKGWTLELDFPGVPKNDLGIEFKEGALHLTVNGSDDSKPAASYRLPLGKQIDTTGITASLDLGVLAIRLPKAAAVTESTRIEIL